MKVNILTDEAYNLKEAELKNSQPKGPYYVRTSLYDYVSLDGLLEKYTTHEETQYFRQSDVNEAFVQTLIARDSDFAEKYRNRVGKGAAQKT
jgi:hypothetical protein